MRFMYYVNGIISTRFNASLALANCYGGDPEMLIIMLKITPRFI